MYKTVYKYLQICVCVCLSVHRVLWLAHGKYLVNVNVYFFTLA